MDFTAWSALALSVVAVLLIPLLALTFRLVIKWTRAEGKLDQAVKDLDGLVKHKDEVHKWLYDQINSDRAVTDKRLRWLEENLWRELKRR